MQKLYILYIPGLADHKNSGLQKPAIRAWRYYGVEPEYIEMNWYKGSWQSKFKRLLQRVDELQSQGHAVALVAASAGATAAINVYAARPDIVGVVLIAGKVNNPDNIREKYRQKYTAFMESIYACRQSLKKIDPEARSRIQSRYALADELVYKPDSRIPGAQNILVPSVGHFLTVGSQIYLAAPFFIRFLKSVSQV